MRKGYREAILAVSVLTLLIGCSRSWHNFSQYPGFEGYYNQHPRSDRAASAAEQTLLTRFQPRLYLDAVSEGPLSFYRDYIAQGVLENAAGETLAERVDRSSLNRYKTDPGVVFIHRPQPTPVTPEAFARIDYDEHPALGRLAFLTYHFVFRDSGLVDGLPGWQDRLLRWTGIAGDWHQLDHYTAATVVLGPEEKPLALILQQHNLQRSYVLGADIPVADDGRIRLISAQRSNELYPWHPGVKRHRVVRFMEPDTLPYLVQGKSKPWLAGYDVTEAVREQDYRLAFIPANDAFYRFAGFLGERRYLPGRDGPPGADYNAVPSFKRPLIQLVAFNWREDDKPQMHALIDFLDRPGIDQAPFDSLLAYFKNKLTSAIAEARLAQER
ncbi:MAG: hypothetical protein ACJAWL_003724 [Motiliproteus sp.]|jgi:hypothetical protein